MSSNHGRAYSQGPEDHYWMPNSQNTGKGFHHGIGPAGIGVDDLGNDSGSGDEGPDD